MNALTSGYQILRNLVQGGGGLQQFTFAVGHLSFLILTVSVVAGLLAHTRWLGKATGRLLDEIHQWAGAWTIYTTLIHALLFRYVEGGMSWINIFFPSLTGRHALPLSLGIYALYAFLAVLVGGYLAGAIKGYLWRWVHWLSFPAWAFAWLHVLLISHVRMPWQQVLYYGGGVLVLGLTAVRFLRRKPKAKTAPPVPVDGSSPA